MQQATPVPVLSRWGLKTLGWSFSGRRPAELAWAWSPGALLVRVEWSEAQMPGRPANLTYQRRSGIQERRLLAECGLPWYLTPGTGGGGNQIGLDEMLQQGGLLRSWGSYLWVGAVVLEWLLWV